MKNNDTPKAIYLKDYKVPSYTISKTDLTFELFENHALVTAELHLKKNPSSKDNDCKLMGEKLECVSITVNDEELKEEQYCIDDEFLEILNPRNEFVLKTVAKIYPQKNTELEGLYQSSGNFCTQCEAEGFRKITWYLDRPDVLSLFTTTIIADKQKYPVMLSNGNLVDSGKTEDGRDWVKWSDPIPKPCYLFALVAGNLVAIKDEFTTVSGNSIALEIFVEAHNKDKCDHAMLSLKNAMKWDEEVYGREYDLDIYMIVAVDDFNMGAMENKGLNVFNSKFVLADNESATDTDYQGIEAVIAHEYFHNWTGNRVTCRDWFQLSLKEGLTVFRDQEFSSDMGSRAVKRIEDVRMLRARQFAEDAGPMAHPIRPESYIEMNNFYTLTVYEKGAEVIRMQHTLLGEEGFRKGTDCYFKRHDGQAVTCDDFRMAMADANDINLDQFEQWYKQAGTPTIAVTDKYDETNHTYSLSFKQTSPNTPGQSNKPPLMIPVKTALITDKIEQEQLIVLTETEQQFVFENVKTKPTPSLLRGFSAPVKLNYDYSDEQLATIIAKDNDDFNRWEACQILATKIILGQEDGIDEEKTKDCLLDGLSAMMDEDIDPALLAESLCLPDEMTLSGKQTPVDIDGIYLYRGALRKQIAMKLEAKLSARYQKLQKELSTQPYKIDSASIAKRQLKNICLAYLGLLAEPEYIQFTTEQYDNANNMTDSFAALSILLSEQLQGFESRLSHFENKWQNNPLVMDKWFALQVTQKRGDIVSVAEKLMKHECFEFSNPNKVRSVVGAFAMSNPVQFHHQSGRGYAFVAEQVAKLDKINPQVAARMVSAFNSYKDYDKDRQAKIKQHLQTLLKQDGLSKGVFEIVTKALAV